MITFVAVRYRSVSRWSCAFERWRPPARNREQLKLQPQLQPVLMLAHRAVEHHGTRSVVVRCGPPG
jgi:hypothetical protein